MRVKKRDGSLQEFKRWKIERAMTMAFTDAKCLWNEDDLKDMVHRIISRCKDPAEVEIIQDKVEEELMRKYPDVAKHYILYRARRTELRNKRLHPDPDAIANYIHPSKYARFIPELKRREGFEETVCRVRQMHIRKFPKLTRPICDIFAHVFEKRVLPSMRSMQFGGQAILNHNARMYNCSFTLIDRPRVFGDILYLLLCGCGVGYSVQFQHVERLPKLKRINKHQVAHFTIPDTIEGWADAIKHLFESHLEGYYIEFDYSEIRPEGSLLESSGGRAPGHFPLKEALDYIRLVLSEAANRKLRPIECHDIVCYLAESVLSGGIRRSSLIALFSHDDGEMMYCKTEENMFTNDQRSMANNSVVLLRDKCTKELFYRIMNLNQESFGEPGFFFTNNLDYGCNPCGEIGIDPTFQRMGAERRATGFGFCNLVEVNAAKCKTEKEFYEACQAASAIATLQATYTEFPYLGSVSEEIVQRDALIGVSITGIMDNPSIALNTSFLHAARCLVEDTNRQWANNLKINYAKRRTCIKPSGTASLELGCVASGIHPHHARRYFRRITANPNEVVAQYFKSINPHMVELKSNGDWCIIFPVEASDTAITNKELTALEFMERIFNVYDSWIGCEEFSHNVSSTVIVKENEWDEILRKAWDNRKRIAAMTFLPARSDKEIPFMPREEVITDKDETKWQYLLNHYKPVDYLQMKEDHDSTVKGATCESLKCDL